jgi:hypothetical protein
MAEEVTECLTIGRWLWRHDEARECSRWLLGGRLLLSSGRIEGGLVEAEMLSLRLGE